MDGLDLGALIGIGALIVLLVFIAPIAYRHDRRVLRRRSDAGVAGSAAVFGGDGGGDCGSDGGGSC